ncbi:MAG: flagellar hook-associated protein FlgL [Oscillospiraceae bacterium]|nr:flagellar hook-associated protein FlgL [Oscillospiraceae bacterium]
MSVRITQCTTNRSYLKNLNNSQHAMNKAMERVETGRDFTRASENVTGATRAIDLRTKLYKNEQMQNNVNTAIEELTMGEDAVATMTDICSTVYSNMLRAMNGSNLTAAKSTFLESLESSKDEIMKLANTTYNNKFVMGGQGTEGLPFKVNDEGYLEFNGAPMSEIEDRFQAGQPESDEKYFYQSSPIKNSGDNFMDVGLDISAVNGRVAPKSAFKTTVDGVKILGYGTSEVSYRDIKTLQSQNGGAGGASAADDDSETVSNNIYNMMTDMQKALESEDLDKLSAILVNFQKQTDNLIAQRSEIGGRMKYLENNLNRLENENTSLLKMQKDTEGVDDATEITNFMGYQNAWNLVLQFGKNVVPKSLMDYVN